MDASVFDSQFRNLTDHSPFPWQAALYERFLRGDIPASCNLPTGLGKTSVIAIWLIALANGTKVPRRLVYVVNRRTVVDQTTDEVEKLRVNLAKVPTIHDALLNLCAIVPSEADRNKPNDPWRPLAISTLRGQFADNREWSVDPCRPAVICGTVDMIGSRLLFSGYGVGFKGKPLHAGFLGQDALLIHDEAHLEPAFQNLIKAIEEEQNERERTIPQTWPRLRVMELTATSRGNGEAFELTPQERELATAMSDASTEPLQIVRQRLSAVKTISLEPIAEEKKELVPAILKHALQFESESEKPAVLVFVRSVDAVQDIVSGLKKAKVADDNIQTLTGTMRGFERDEMARSNKVFARFQPGREVDKQPGTVFLVCTSAGEVGVDISADHLVCDLSTFECMAQRFGRVNRYGDKVAQIIVIHPVTFDEKDYDDRRRLTLELLQELGNDASPNALGRLDSVKRQAAFAPEPTLLPTSDILFDAWALTTIKDKLPGRPPVEPYLHGLPTDWQPPETQVAWRTELDELKVDMHEEYPPEEFLEAFPLKPHELLRDNSRRVYDALEERTTDPKPNAKDRKEATERAAKNRSAPVWIVDDFGSITRTTLGELIDEGKEALYYQTIVLPTSIGGLNGVGMLDGASNTATDVAEEWFIDKDRKVPRRFRSWEELGDSDPKSGKYRQILVVRFPSPTDDEDADAKHWHWYELAENADGDWSKTSKAPIEWQHHTDDVVSHAKRIVEKLPLYDSLKASIILAAELHDLGKKRRVWQRSIGNWDVNLWLAKSGGKMRLPSMNIDYRHEFGSLGDILDVQLPHHENLMREGIDHELVLHLVAAHHGYGRPHFPPNHAIDPQQPGSAAAATAAEVPRRFARLQRKFGRWGLAYLESLLRAADWAASANPSEPPKENRP